jgi:hypothetical protein
MAYNIDWYVENRVIYARMAGDVNPQEFRTLLQNSVLMIDDVEDGEVHLIYDFSRLDLLQNFGQIVQAIPKTRQEQMGWMIMVGDSTPIKRFWSEAIARVALNKYKRLDKVEQALAFLQKQDPNIDWTLANPLLMAENWPLLQTTE